MNQVHKETLSHVENALPNRQGLDVEIFGVEGMPEDVRKQHEERIVKNYFDAQRERFEATGNPPPGEGRPQKKIRVESAEDLKKRFAEFRAKKAAAKAAGVPFTGVQNPAVPANVQSPAQAGSPGTFVSCLLTVFIPEIKANLFLRYPLSTRPNLTVNPLNQAIPPSQPTALHHRLPTTLTQQHPPYPLDHPLSPMHRACPSGQGTHIPAKRLPATLLVAHPRWTSWWPAQRGKGTTSTSSSEWRRLASSLAAHQRLRRLPRLARRSPRRTRVVWCTQIPSSVPRRRWPCFPGTSGRLPPSGLGRHRHDGTAGSLQYQGGWTASWEAQNRCSSWVMSLRDMDTQGLHNSIQDHCTFSIQGWSLCLSHIVLLPPLSSHSGT